MRLFHKALLVFTFFFPLLSAGAQNISTSEHGISLALEGRWKCKEQKIAGEGRYFPQWRVACTDLQPYGGVQHAEVYLWIVPSDDSAITILKRQIRRVDGWLAQYAGRAGYTDVETPVERVQQVSNGFSTITHRVRVSGHLRNIVFFSMNHRTDDKGPRVLGWVRNTGVDKLIDEDLLKNQILAKIAQKK